MTLIQTASHPLQRPHQDRVFHPHPAWSGRRLTTPWTRCYDPSAVTAGRRTLLHVAQYGTDPQLAVKAASLQPLAWGKRFLPLQPTNIVPNPPGLCKLRVRLQPPTSQLSAFVCANSRCLLCTRRLQPNKSNSVVWLSRAWCGQDEHDPHTSWHAQSRLLTTPTTHCYARSLHTRLRSPQHQPSQR